MCLKLSEELSSGATLCMNDHQGVLTVYPGVAFLNWPGVYGSALRVKTGDSVPSTPN